MTNLIIQHWGKASLDHGCVWMDCSTALDSQKPYVAETDMSGILGYFETFRAAAKVVRKALRSNR